MTPAIFEVYAPRASSSRWTTTSRSRPWTPRSTCATAGSCRACPIPCRIPRASGWTPASTAKEIRYGVQEGRMLTALMENAYIADRERREVKF